MSWLSDHWTRAFDPLNLTGADTTAKRDAQARGQSYIDANPRPNDPTWNPIWDENVMAMGPELDTKLAGTTLDTRGLDKFRSEALREGPSNWAMRAHSAQGLEADLARDRGAREVAGQTATGRAALAMRGGLGGGAAERLASDAGRNYLDMSQDVSATQARNNAQIDMNDEQTRIQQLGMLPGMDLAAGNFDLDKVKLWGQGKQFDVTNMMKNKESQNQFTQNAYNQKMQAWAAAQQASATENAGKHKK